MDIMGRIMKLVESVFAVMIGVIFLTAIFSVFYQPTIDQVTNLTGTIGNTMALTIWRLIYWVVAVGVMFGLAFILLRLAFKSYSK